MSTVITNVGELVTNASEQGAGPFAALSDAALVMDAGLSLIHI